MGLPYKLLHNKIVESDTNFFQVNWILWNRPGTLMMIETSNLPEIADSLFRVEVLLFTTVMVCINFAKYRL